jgi:UDP:flavonoid glycosyltransferase YjiC (YdhE family)
VLAPLPFTRYLRRAPRALHRLLLGAAKRMTRAWIRPVHDLRRSLGLCASRDPLFAGRFSPRLNLALFSPILAAAQPDWPASTVQPGFVFYETAESEGRDRSWESFMQAGPAPIVFTLGSAAVASAGDFFLQSVEAAKRLGRRALLLAGKHADTLELPATMAAFEYASYAHVFPRAAAVVHQGGIGTTAQALRAGVPQLVVPFAFDQPDNAARLERLGVGRSIARSRYRADAAARLLEEVLGSRRYADRARDASRRIQAEQGMRIACDAIERRLLGRRNGADGGGIGMPGAR